MPGDGGHGLRHVLALGRLVDVLVADQPRPLVTLEPARGAFVAMPSVEEAHGGSSCAR